MVTRNGKDAVVILSAAEYQRIAATRGGATLAQFLAESPLADVALHPTRPRDSGRPVKL